MVAPTPRQVPDVRLEFLDAWKTRGRFAVRIDSDETSPEWETQVLRDAGLWWISSAMMDVLVAGMRDVPHDITPEELQPPDEQPGLVVFEKPLESIAREGRPLLVDAVAWGGSIRPVLRRGQSELAVAVSSYVRVNPSRPHGEPFVEPRTQWVYLGQSTWPVNDSLTTTLYDGQGDGEATSTFDDRRLIAAMWTFLTQPGIGDRETVAPDRATARRHKRADLEAENAQVQVITLRRVHRDAEEPAESETSAREYSHQWVVSGHWRRQRVGEGLTQTRLVWISPYVKGPNNKPLRTPEVVRAWVR